MVNLAGLDRLKPPPLFAPMGRFSLQNRIIDCPIEWVRIDYT